MVSRLDSIVPPHLRYAESTDTHRGIHREDTTDDRRRKQDDREKEEEQAVWEDKTILSTTALHAFLKGLLSTHAPAPVAEPAQTEAAPAPRQPINPARTAASAYASTARHGHSEYCDVPPPVAQPAASSSNSKLNEEESIKIQTLIKDLEILMARGLQEITLLKSDNFLQSLIDAVNAAR